MKRVLITGAAGGMGVVCSEQALAEGCEVILADMENLALSELVRKLESKRGNVEACCFDITDVQSIDGHTGKNCFESPREG